MRTSVPPSEFARFFERNEAQPRGLCLFGGLQEADGEQSLFVTGRIQPVLVAWIAVRDHQPIGAVRFDA